MINAYLADGYKKENILIFSPERLSEELLRRQGRALNLLNLTGPKFKSSLGAEFSNYQ